MPRKARFYGIPVYFDPEDDSRMVGRTWLADIAASIMLYLHALLLLGDFRLTIEEDEHGD